MPAHIGFLDRLKIAVNLVSINLGQSKAHRTARSTNARRKALARLAAQHPDMDQVDLIRLSMEDQRVGEFFFGGKEFSKLYRDRMGRKRHIDVTSYTGYRQFVDQFGPEGHDTIPAEEWNNCLDTGTAFDAAVQAAFRSGYRILLVRGGSNGSKHDQLKRIEAYKGDVWRPEHSVTMWSLAHGWT